jgi:hypothetical protein
MVGLFVEKVEWLVGWSVFGDALLFGLCVQMDGLLVCV